MSNTNAALASLAAVIKATVAAATNPVPTKDFARITADEASLLIALRRLKGNEQFDAQRKALKADVFDAIRDRFDDVLPDGNLVVEVDDADADDYLVLKLKQADGSKPWVYADGSVQGDDDTDGDTDGDSDGDSDDDVCPDCGEVHADDDDTPPFIALLKLLAGLAGAKVGVVRLG